MANNLAAPIAGLYAHKHMVILASATGVPYKAVAGEANIAMPADNLAAVVAGPDAHRHMIVLCTPDGVPYTI